MDSFISLTPEHYLSADDTIPPHSYIYTFAGHAIANVLCRHHLVSVLTATQCSQINCAVLSEVTLAQPVSVKGLMTTMTRGFTT